MRSGIQSSGVWNSLSKSISEAIEAVQDRFVTIHGGGRSTSSRVVWRPGVVVTVCNSLRRGEIIKVARGDDPFDARVAGTDAGTDLVVLRAESNSLRPAEASDLESMRVGELARVLGNTASLLPKTGLWGVRFHETSELPVIRQRQYMNRGFEQL
jgi:S1-C subfamily serine protease